MDNDFDSRDTYFTKDGETIGVHAIGCAGPHTYQVQELDGSIANYKSDFQIMEIWGNKYDANFKMKGGSFRIFSHNYEEEIQWWLKDGWTIVERPTNG